MRPGKSVWTPVKVGQNLSELAHIVLCKTVVHHIGSSRELTLRLGYAGHQELLKLTKR